MKTNQDHQRIAAALDRLFRTYGPLGQGSTPEEVTRDRIERIKVYFEAVSLYSEDDVEAAVEAILTGDAPGMNPNFAPPAPAVAGECRRQMHLRLRRAELARFRTPRLPPPDIEKTDDQRARARALMEAAVDNLSSATALDSAESLASSKARWEKINERFHPDMSDDAVMDRLIHKRPRYTAGNDAEDYAA